MKKKPKIKSVKEYPYGGAALSGALTGASLGMELGPWGALAGAGVGAGLGYVNAQNQEAQNKQYAIDQNLNNIRNQQIQRIKSAPIVEGAPQVAFANGGQMKIGEKIEKEHKGTLNKVIFDAQSGKLKPMKSYYRGIAKDHLNEFKDYYTRLTKMEEEGENSPDNENSEYKNGGIHIKPSHKGRFTAYKQRTGKTTEEALHSKDPHVRQMANFARNAAKWKHENGGIHQDFLNDAEVYNYPNGGITGFTLTPSDYFPNGGTSQQKPKYVTPLANLNNFYMPTKKPTISNKKYENGGMSVTNDNNAEVEKQEVMRSPDGSTMQVDGNSHENGGVPVNIPNGTQIYSDRLKDPETKKTFAKLASKYKVNKEEEILENKKSSSLATNTAKLNMQIKQQKLNEIFNKQELLKRSKVGNYAKKLGVDISQLSSNNGSHYQQPEDHPEELKYAYGGIKKYWVGGTNNQPSFMNQNTQFNQVNPQQFGQQPNEGYTANYDGTNSGLPYSSKEGTFDSMGNKLRDPYGQKISGNTSSWQNAAITAGNLLGPVYGLATNVAPQTYDIAKPEFKQYNPTNALAQADQENRLAREQARVNSGGNANAYLSSLAALQSNLTRNKAGIQQQYDQMNIGTYNQAQLPIAQMQTQRNIDRQHDVTANRDFKTGYVGQIGNIAAQGALGNKASQQDMDYLNWLKQVYPNVRSRYNPSSNI